ncbi:hypothetical protein J437_LFUL006428, partial [Ladona fulva]
MIKTLGCLIPFLPLHMRSAGLSAEEALIVSMVAPAFSILGPLAVGPLADRLASGLWGQSGSKAGSEKGGELKDYTARTKGHRRLRTLLAVLVFLSAVAYCLLLLVVPIVTRRDARTPHVSFRCGEHVDGGTIVQEKCADECHEWGGERFGSVVLTDCRCEEAPDTSYLTGEESTENLPETTTLPYPKEPDLEVETPDFERHDEIDDYDDTEEKATEASTDSPINDSSVQNKSLPHLCFSGSDSEAKGMQGQGSATCHAFSSPESSLAINATLTGTLLSTKQDELCVYPISSFNIKGMEYSNLSCLHCSIFTCSIDQPYNHINYGVSLLGPSGSCPNLLGDPRLTFWSYLIVRSVADCFPAAALTVLDTTLLLPSLISPGKQLASGALGIAIAAPITSGLLILQQNEWSYTFSSSTFRYLPFPWPPFVLFSFFALIVAVLLLIFPMPVLLGEEARKPRKVYKNSNCEPRPSQPSPVLYPRRPRPRTRLGPYPPPKLSTHADVMGVSEVTDNNETIAENGTMEDNGQNGWLAPSPPPYMLLLLLGILMTAAALPAMPLMWYAEKFIEICGHANILILAFTAYIVRYSVFSFVENGWWCILSEAVAAPMSLGLAWVTAVHYTHLLCPPRMSATAQAAAVVAHFCIGRCLGAVIGAFIWMDFDLKIFLQGGAIAAAIIGFLYFLIYHCCLKTRCVGGSGGMKAGSSGGVAWGGGRGNDSSFEGTGL